ncbi:MAG: LysM peptidoglycan-binding domain-containing protein [Anaerolineaceae bacterium]
MRELLIGLLAAIASITVVMGGITLSAAQVQPATLSPTLSPTIVLPTNTLSLSATVRVIASPSPTVTTGLSPTATATSTPTPTSTVTELSPTSCPPPKGWQKYVVPSGTSLDNLARTRGITVDQLMEANCLADQNLMPDTMIYVPPLQPARKPTRTKRPGKDTPAPTLAIMKVTPVPCGQPHGWVIYHMQAGDTLYHLGTIFNITTMKLAQANCVQDSSFIYPGQQLYVPILLRETPTDFPTQAPPATHKAINRVATATSLPTCTLCPTQTPSTIPADTNSPTYTPSVTSTNTLTVTPTTKTFLSPTGSPVP